MVARWSLRSSFHSLANLLSFVRNVAAAFLEINGHRPRLREGIAREGVSRPRRNITPRRYNVENRANPVNRINLHRFIRGAANEAFRDDERGPGTYRGEIVRQSTSSRKQQRSLETYRNGAEVRAD